MPVSISAVAEPAAQSSVAARLIRPITVARPPRIEIGIGTVRLAGERARSNGITRTLVVSDAFNAARVGRLNLPGTVTVFADVVFEPDVPNLERLLEVARMAAPELVVGFGGGSAMDLAKLAAVMVGSSKPIRDIVGAGRADARKVQLIQIPTTSGTGSEGGTRALLTDPETRNKIAIESSHMLADVAIIDPELTVSLPPAVTAATGIDALAHCTEAFTSTRSHPVIDVYAREGIALVGQFLMRAVRDGGDIEARAGLALASHYGGFCLGPVNTTAGHAVAYPLGTRHKVPHGLAVAVIFPHVLAHNAPACAEKTAEIAALLQLEGDLREAAYRFCADTGVEMRMSKLGVPEEDLPLMADEAHAIRRLLDFNPRDVSRDEILGMYRAAW
jgi:alcohol dehydrogenase class IV